MDNQQQLQNDPDTLFESRLDEYESIWQSGSIPDIAPWLKADRANRRYLSDLIELDLELRWKRYAGRNPEIENPVDEFGFPLFPGLEDYAAIETVDETGVMTAELAAEEFRARTLWGDGPDVESFVERFRQLSEDIRAAIRRVETELLRESERNTLNAETNSGGVDVLRTTIAHLHEPDESVSGSEFLQHLGRYRLIARVGKGGFGEVWKAYDPELDRSVAVKFPRTDKQFPPHVLAAFRTEGRKLAKLGRIPGIVTVFDTGESTVGPFIVSDFIEGNSLEGHLNRNAEITPDQAAKLIAEVAEALHRAHLRGFIHRDIKPANILLDTEGNPYLADFGLAVTEEDQLAETRGTLGTLVYMSPEQAAGHNRYANAQSDIYSLGVILYRLLTGRLPFLASRLEDYRDQILHRAPRAPRTIDDEIPAELERICLKCLARKPADRYTTASDLAAELRNHLRETDSVARRGGRMRALVLGVAAALLCSVGVWLAYSWPNQSHPPNGNDKKADPADSTAERPFHELPPAEIKPATWYPLLTVSPRTIFGAEAAGSGKHFDADSQSLLLATQQGTMYALGNLQHKDFTIRVDLRHNGAWRGSAGLFFGLSHDEDLREDVGAIRPGQVVLVAQNRKEDFKTHPIMVARRHLEVRHNIFQTVAPDDPISEFHTAAPVPGTSTQLQVRFINGRVSQVRWGGSDIPMLRRPDVNDLFGHPVGTFGLFTMGASGVTFEKAEIRIEKTR